jgi:hypothetical protein
MRRHSQDEDELVRVTQAGRAEARRRQVVGGGAGVVGGVFVDDGGITRLWIKMGSERPTAVATPRQAAATTNWRKYGLASLESLLMVARSDGDSCSGSCGTRGRRREEPLASLIGISYLGVPVPGVVQ